METRLQAKGFIAVPIVTQAADSGIKRVLHGNLLAGIATVDRVVIGIRHIC